MNKLFYVIGPPGCGKSAYIARQAQRAVEEHGPDRVAIGSFTRAAAVNIASRDTHVHDDMIGTLHSWCFHALGRPTIAESKIKEWNEAHPRLALSGRFDAADPIGTRSGEGTDQAFADYMLLRAKLVPPSAWPLGVAAFASTWTDWKEQNFYKDFTDLLEYGLAECDVVPGFPKVLFIDEAQDNNPLQHALVAKWANNTETTVLCGDPDQTIYSFAGSDPLAFYRAPTEQKLFPPTLRHSWRVPRVVHDWAKQWISQIAERDAVDYEPKGEDGAIERSSMTSSNGGGVVELIQQHLDEGTVAVLATCGYMLAPTLQALRAAAIPFWNPYRVSRGDWNPLGKVAGRLTSFLQPCSAVTGARAQLWNGPELHRWSSTVRAAGVFRRGAKKRIEELKEQAKLELYEIMMLFEEGIFEDILGRMDAGLPDATAWLVNHIINDGMYKTLEYPLRVLERHGLAGLTTEPKVIVGTGHSLKGGEADTVICFPDLSGSGWREWDSVEARNALVRLGYVMGTRAKHRLILAGGQGLW